MFSSATKEEGCVTGYQEEFCTVSSEQSASIVVIYILLVMKEVLFDDMDHQKVWTKRVVEQLAAKVKALANHKGTPPSPSSSVCVIVCLFYVCYFVNE